MDNQDPSQVVEQTNKESQFAVTKIPAHTHNGTDSLFVDIGSIQRFPHSPLQGDITYFDGKQWLSLPAGTSGQLLETLGVNANPRWLSVKTFDYGNGSDGSPVLTGTTTLSRDMFYDVLTMQSTATLKPNGFKIFAKTSITIAGNVTIAGSNGTAGGPGGDVSSVGASGAGGTAGSGGAGTASGTLKQPGSGANGNTGMNGGQFITANNFPGTAGTNETNGLLPNNGSKGGDSGTGAEANGLGAVANGSTGGSGGTMTMTTSPASLAIVTTLVNFLGGNGCNPGSGSGAGGGGGARSSGNDDQAGGGGGGGAGAPGGLMWLASPSITISNGGIVSAAGGNGGNGGRGGNATLDGINNDFAGGGGGGGAGGNGGLIILITPSYTNNGTVTVSGGTGGTGGAKGVPTSPSSTIREADGSNGINGSNGALVLISP